LGQSPMTPHGRTLVFLLLVLATERAWAEPLTTPRPSRQLTDILVTAYPDMLTSHDGGDIVWKDGTRMPFGLPQPVRDATAAKPLDERDPLFAKPALADMFHWRYPMAMMPPVDGADPGRIRVEAFFTKMYGDCRKGEVAPNLVTVPWLPKKKGGTIKVTRINGVAEKVAVVSAELDELPASFDKFLVPSAGGYHCRPIAGTQRLSAHGSGTAIDLALKRAHYWRWSKSGAKDVIAYRNAIPSEIVSIFEKHGFIWGGKWHHYDTMHFEYRPELLPPRKDAEGR
jgi:D-alanyl-D-alanine carboxypeptidase